MGARVNRLLIFSLFALVGFAIPAQTSANIIGNDTANFNPNPSGLDFITVHGSDTLGRGLVNSGLFFNRAKNTLPTTTDLTGARVDPEDTVTFMDFGLAYGLSSRFEVGLSFSTLLDQKVERSSPGAQFASTGLNDIRVSTKYQFLEKEPVGLAAVVSVDMNQARNNPFSGSDSGPTLNFEGVVDFEWLKTHFAGNLGYRLRSRGQPIPGALYKPLPDQIVASGAISHYFSSVDLKLIAEGFLAKSTESVSQLDAATISTEFLLGAKYDFSSNWAGHIGGGTRLSEGLFTPEWRVYVGLGFVWDALSAPAPVSSVASAASPAVSSPGGPILIQRHYRGYLPEDIDRLKGTDFDEIARRHEFQLRTDVPDADLAGEKPPFEIIRLEGFDFDFASDVIRDEHAPLIEKLARYLKARPAVIKVRVEGHTDSIGADERKKALGMRRAENVVRSLKKTGLVEGIRFEPVGFGAERPIADNSNYQGRKQNRRVEIRILRRIEDAPVRVN